jgi:hypothetical protein
MARKKRSKSKANRKISKKSNFKIGDLKKKLTVVINNLLLFVALSLVSFVLYRFLQNEILKNLFNVMSMVFGFVSVAFLIALLVLLILRTVKKR